jgi:tetratricopeptide (TPR) repeat protein
VTAKRLTKKELKEDKIAETLVAISEWVRGNVGALIAVGVAIVVVIFAGTAFLRGKAKAEEDASVALLQAKAEMWRSNYAAATPLFQMLSQRYGSTTAGREALYYLGNMAFLQGKADEARAGYQRFLTGGSRNELLKQAALGGIGAAYEATGSYAEAAKQYEELARRYPKDNLVAPRAYLAAGRCYEALGQFGQARTAYERALKDYPESSLRASAQSALAMLTGK